MCVMFLVFFLWSFLSWTSALFFLTFFCISLDTEIVISFLFFFLNGKFHEQAWIRMQSRGCRQLGRIEETKSACFGKVTSLNILLVIFQFKVTQWLYLTNNYWRRTCFVVRSWRRMYTLLRLKLRKKVIISFVGDGSFVNLSKICCFSFQSSWFACKFIGLLIRHMKQNCLQCYCGSRQGR